MDDRINEPIADDDVFICEGISNEEYMRRFMAKYELYNEGKLTREDFQGFEVFLLSDLLKAEALAMFEQLEELVRQRNIEMAGGEHPTA